jgi:large subunit ribosomal protein L7/L12
MNHDEIVQAIGDMTILEVTELVKTLEDKFNVSGDLQMSAPALLAEEVEEEPTEFDVWLDTFGQKKVGVIKAVRVITGFGLKDSKLLTESAPGARIVACVNSERAAEVKKELEDAGGRASIKGAAE